MCKRERETREREGEREINLYLGEQPFSHQISDNQNMGIYIHARVFVRIQIHVLTRVKNDT